MVEEICGVVVEHDAKADRYTIDREKTMARRNKIRESRKKKAVPVDQWMTGQKKRIEAYDLPDVALEIYRDVSSHSIKWMKEFRDFWGVDDAFTFQIDSIRDVNPVAMRSGVSRVADDPLEF
jgi:hypothetical protein